MAIFICESGADKRKVFHLTTGTLVCGRSEDADLMVQDPFVSGKHFQLVNKDGAWFVEDLGSSNGLELNDAKSTGGRLHDGDLLRAGSTYLRYYERDDSAEEASRAGLPRIEGYEISERIGVGGMGEVYRARQLSLDREVALKILSPAHARDREFVSKFFREARSSGNLNHPNIVQVHDVGESGGVCYMCMEFVGGGDLTSRLRGDGGMPTPEVIRIIGDVARGLEFAESRQIVHCDIKPDNIMFTESGMPKIADLGIARSASGYQERKKEVFGSPHYMAPEQAMGKPVDCRADLYALGCTMFRMLTGRTPFSGASAREVMKKQVMEEHPDILKLVPDCPPELADIVDYLMEKKPEDRCPSATELLRLLSAVHTRKRNSKSSTVRKRTGRPAGVPTRTSVRPPEPVAPLQRLSGGAKLALAAAAVVVLGVVAKVLFLSGNSVQDVLDQSRQREKTADYAGAIQLLKQYGTPADRGDAARITARLNELERAQATAATKLKFQRHWNDYLSIRANASKAVLEKKLEYLQSLLDDKNYPDEMRILNSERMQLMGRK